MDGYRHEEWEPTDEERAAEREAREVLTKAIRAYFGDERFLLNFVLVAEVTDTALEQEGKTMTTYIQGWDQSFVATRGLLDIALNADRNR